MAYIFLPNQAASLATISRSETGRASTLFSVQRQIGSAAGIATLGSVMALVGTTIGGAVDGPPNVDGYHAAYMAAAVLAFVGAAFALRVPDSEAAATMVPQTRRVRQTSVEAAAKQPTAGG
jgi:hypothetical protein